MKNPRLGRAILAGLCCAAFVGCRATDGAGAETTTPAEGLRAQHLEIQYLEIVTSEVEATCASIGESHGVSFGPPQDDLGGARTAALAGGGMIGVRAPMHSQENTVVRPYLLVDDVEAAVERADAAGAQIMLPPTTIEGRGTFAIYFLGGIEHGLWQL